MDPAADSSIKPIWTIDQIADQLIDDYWESTGRQARSFDIATGGTLTVDLAGLSASGQATAREALDVWTQISGIQFQEASQTADIRFDDANSGAYASTFTLGDRIVWSQINVAANFATGPYYLQTFIHEIGHALGLGHAGDYNGGGGFDQDAEFANDTWQYSAMSYFHQGFSRHSDASVLYLETPMIADILAIHRIYGLPTSVLTGDTVYGDGVAATSGMTLDAARARTLVDSGGIDTIDFGSRAFNQRLDLNEEAFSDIDGYRMNLVIARGTIIENAITGTGHDTVTGNATANLLDGGGGNDRLFGGAGDDILVGGTGSDLIDGGSGYDTAYFVSLAASHTIARSGKNFIVAGADGSDTLINTEKLLFRDMALDLVDASKAFYWLGSDAALSIKSLKKVIDGQNATKTDTGSESKVEANPAAMEVGTVALPDHRAGKWIQVDFEDEILDAIVVAGPLSSNGKESALVEIRNVTSTGFEIRLAEWAYLDGGHIDETVSWTAGTAGTHRMADGSSIHFGQQTLSGSAGQMIALEGFDRAPIVVGSLEGTGDAILTHRVHTVKTDGFKVFMQAEEAQRSSVDDAARTFNFVALAPERGGDIDSGSLSVGHGQRTVRGVELGNAFFADMQTAKGGDTATLRYDWKGSRYQVSVAEEQSGDREVRHGSEKVAWFSLDQGRQVFSSIERYASDAAAMGGSSTLEVGRVHLNRTDANGWIRVSFSEKIEDAVVVTGPLSMNGGDAAVAEIRNVDDTGFDIRLSEWDSGDGRHGRETISWMAGSSGTHLMADGTRITFETDEIVGNEIHRLDISGYDRKPTFFGTLEGEGSYVLTHRFDNANRTGIDVTMQSEELRRTLVETEARSLNWIAIETGNGSVVTGARAVVSDRGQAVTHMDPNEGVFADMQSFRGADPANLRFDTNGSGRITIIVDEETSADRETRHAAEVARWLKLALGAHDLVSAPERASQGPDPFAAGTDDLMALFGNSAASGGLDEGPSSAWLQAYDAAESREGADLPLRFPSITEDFDL